MNAKLKPNKLTRVQLKNLEVAKAVNACGGKIRAISWGGRAGERRYYGYRIGRNPVILNHLGHAVMCAVDHLVDPYK